MLCYEISFLFFHNFPLLLSPSAFFRAGYFYFFPFDYLAVLLIYIWCQNLWKEILFKVEKVDGSLICKRISGHLLKVITAGKNTYILGSLEYWRNFCSPQLSSLPSLATLLSLNPVWSKIKEKRSVLGPYGAGSAVIASFFDLQKAGEQIVFFFYRTFCQCSFTGKGNPTLYLSQDLLAWNCGRPASS